MVAGWLIHDFTHPPAVVAADNFVDEAVASHQVLMLRDEMRSQPETLDFQAGEILRATGIAMPRLPGNWQVRDVQVFPSDTGPSVQLLIATLQHDRFTLVVMKRSDTSADRTPILERRRHENIAYWEQNGLAIALVGQGGPGELLRIASDLALSGQATTR